MSLNKGRYRLETIYELSGYCFPSDKRRIGRHPLFLVFRIKDLLQSKCKGNRHVEQLKKYNKKQKQHDSNFKDETKLKISLNQILEKFKS